MFVLADRYRHLAGVRLEQDLGLGGVAFTRERTQWWLRMPRPPVDRMEYLFEVEDANGHRSTITDPANPLRAPGAFGDKSVLEFPDYRAPAWLDAAGVPGVDERPRRRRSAARQRAHRRAVGTRRSGRRRARSAAGRARRARVRRARRLHRLPRGHDRRRARCRRSARRCSRPGERNDWYSANPAYAQHARVATCCPRCPRQRARIGVGVSLGALAMLHAHRTQPPGASTACSCSRAASSPRTWTRRSPGSAGSRAVTEFVDVGARSDDADAAPGARRCSPAASPRRTSPTTSGWPLRCAGSATRRPMHTVRDAHNYTAWRDALHPHLTGLINDGGGRPCGVNRSSSDQGTLIAYGHYGRPVLVFPSEQGRAWDFENNGMVDAVADLIDAGRVKLYCVDSADAWTLVGPLGARSRSAPGDTPTTRRGSAAGSSPWISDDCGGQLEIVTLGCSLGAYHAVELRAQARATSSRSRCACRATTTRRRGTRGASRATRPTSTTRWPTSPNLSGDHLDWLRERRQPAAGRRPGRVGGVARPVRCRAPAPSPTLLAAQGHPSRARRVGLRRPARLAVLARQLAHHLPRFC